MTCTGYSPAARMAPRRPASRGEHRRGEPLVVGGRDGAQVEQQPPALDPADDRGHVAAAHRRARPQAGGQRLGQGQRGARQRHAGAAAAADRGVRRHRLAVDARARPAARPGPRPAP